MSIVFNKSGKKITMNLAGDFTKSCEEVFFPDFANVSEIFINGKELGLWDSSLVVQLFKVMKEAKSRQISITLVQVPEELQHLLKLALTVPAKHFETEKNKLSLIEAVGEWGMDIYKKTLAAISFIKNVLHSLGRLSKHQAVFRNVDFLYALEECTYKAVPIVFIISFMVGVILAFVGAIQLKMFGAQVYVASLVMIGMIRIMGAVMTGIIIAGRTGASYAATIGTMQVNEEIDALKTMSIPVTDFLVLPRVMALTISMPILTLFADFCGIFGGAVVGILMLDIAPAEYIRYSMNAFGLTHFLVGIFHGVVFGVVIALCGCYHGINCGRNADSVGKSTTQAVVSAIVGMIIMTGVITVLCEVFEI